ncbi:cytochrome c biogenesis protein CcdA [Bengtsoniella intestinalis]|uniref:redoxin family protein n=1 Tax=Bengtsoniella intestinalis TaxID=3073143 RepID=UPI00391FC0E9
MGFDLNVSIPALTVFLQGIFSFFSPCVLPIIPLYMGYLSGGVTYEDGQPQYNRKMILVNTVFFIIGVSFAFALLGIGVSALGQFFTQNQMIFSRVGGIVVVLLGLMQLGVFDKPFGGREWKLPVQLNVLKMNPVTALLMGFTFSFAWTPCVGPALSTVLIMVSSANSSLLGMMLMGVYTIGFTLPFLLVGLFTTQALALLKRHQNLVTYTVKIGAVVMIAMGLMMFTGTMNQVTSYLSVVSTEVEEPVEETGEQSTQTAVEAETPAEEPTTVASIDFTLVDQFGDSHTLSDYKGKVVFLNFWATWCSPCRSEMPDIQALYEAYGENTGDVIILGVCFPTDSNNYTQEGTTQEVIDFMAEGGYTYPALMDTSGSLLYSYGISAFPTTFMIDVDGNVFGYLSGAITYEIMESIIAQTQAG